MNTVDCIHCLYFVAKEPSADEAACFSNFGGYCHFSPVLEAKATQGSWCAQFEIKTRQHHEAWRQEWRFPGDT